MSTVKYFVRTQETLSTIARRHNITVENLCQSNGIEKTQHVPPGYLLKIPSGKQQINNSQNTFIREKKAAGFPSQSKYSKPGGDYDSKGSWLKTKSNASFNRANSLIVDQTAGFVVIEMLAFIPGRLGSPISKLISETNLKAQKEFEEKLLSIPGTFSKEPGSSTIPYLWNGTPAFRTPWFFATDDRDFGGGTYRLGLAANIGLSSIGKLGSQGRSDKKDGPFLVSCSESKRISVVLAGWGQGRKWVVMTQRDRAEAFSKQKVIDNSKNSSTCSVSAHATYPFVSPGPDIQIDAEFKLSVDLNGNAHVKVSGEHNEFPCYEVRINGKEAYRYEAKGEDGPGLINLSRMTSFESKEIVVTKVPGSALRRA